ncbi:MAG: TIGR01458 family HAD-type hydrolase [Gammaproteobacteria bacterium]|nr:MAG: TIGR01458 family HAD-type hydrolase [Gammaproteobacteria bacterium]
MLKLNPQLILFDLDGTLYVSNQAIPGAVDALDRLREHGFQLRFLTNTTTKSQAQLVEQLRSLNFSLDTHELISAPVAAQLELQSMQKKAARTLRIWPVVADAIKKDFSEFEIGEISPDVVVLGDIGDRWDLDLINKLFNAIHGGAQLIALHKNRFWQTDDGLKADIGFFVAGLEYVCNMNARVMGKPNADFFQRVLDSVSVSARETMMVGDDIDSDVGGAQELGIKGCLVKTGKFRQGYYDQSTIKPDMVAESVVDFADRLLKA